jgi:hypothetical protein
MEYQVGSQQRKNRHLKKKFKRVARVHRVGQLACALDRRPWLHVHHIGDWW